MKQLVTTAVCLLVMIVSIQAQKGIEAMIQAEKSFAAYSVSHSTKEAFLQYIDSNSIMFDSGKAVKALDFWNKREKNAGVLNWWPQYAEIAITGDFGYTTGPWTYQPSKNDSIVARGQYTTVWRLTPNGEWKFLVDLGIDNTQPVAMSEVTRVETPKTSGRTLAIPHIAPLIARENNFQLLFKKNISKAYKKCLSTQSILNRHGYLPAITSAEQKTIITTTPANIQFTLTGLSYSPEEDMGYVYGAAVRNGKTENYLHVWRHEKEGWVLALEVLRY
jgi:hypothetical protein